MTCQQYRDWIDHADYHGTAGERAAVQRHVAGCQSCSAWTDAQIKAEMRTCSLAEIIESYAAVVETQIRDSFDPETRP